MTASSMVGRLARRTGWEVYRTRVSATRLAWDALALGRNSLPQEAIRYREDYPPFPGQPPLMADDTRYVREVVTARVARIDRPALVEARYGHVVTRPLTLIPAALQRAEDARSRSMMQYFSRFPSMPRVAAGLIAPAPELEHVVTARHVYDFNYYHALVDVLLGLALIDRTSGLRDTPVLVGPALARQRFFRDIRSAGPFARVNWVEHTRDVRTRSTTFARATARDDTTVQHLLHMLDVPPPRVDSGGRLFLGRRPHDGRHVSNWAELRSVLVNAGFELVDAGELSFSQQVELLRGARYVVAVHGAALANMLFRRGAPLDVLELLSPNVPSPAFWELATALGFTHRYLIGERAEGGASRSPFSVDPRALEKALEHMLTAPGPAEVVAG